VSDPVSGLIRSTIRADMEARIESVAVRLEADATHPDTEEDLVRVMAATLTEVTEIVAAGLLARISLRARLTTRPPFAATPTVPGFCV